MTAGISHIDLVGTIVSIGLLGFAGPVLAQDPPVDSLLIGHWDGYEGVYSDLWSDGQYVYMGNWALGDGLPARMHIIDISDPTHPFLDNTFFFPNPNQFASPQEVMVVDGLAYVALEGDGNHGVAILDVRDPTSPSLLATTLLPGYDDTHNIFFADGFLYMCDSQTPRVGILDLRDFDPDNPPPSPITVATWILQNVGNSFVHEIAAIGDRLYCAGWNDGVFVYDISDVANTMPTLLGSVDGTSTHSMWPTDDGKFMVTGEERANGGIKVYRITDNGSSLTFALTDSLVMASEAFSVHNQTLVGYRLFDSWYQAGIQVHDINPVTGKLEFRSSFDTSVYENTGGYAGNWGIFPFLGDDRVLASDMQNGLYIVATKQDDCSPSEDCNGNAISDFCDLIEGTSADCNTTFVPDECELADGSSIDCQPNGVPDECETDCNANGVADECDISGGDSADCQPNGVPDECETDCNANVVPDDCDIAAGFSLDCQPNGIPDECDIASGPSVDVPLSQSPDHLNGFVADADDSSAFNPGVAAENVTFKFPQRIEAITIWGAYLLADTPSTDHFTIIVHEDAAGLPGDEVTTITQVPSTRVKTGVVLFGSWDEYKITLTPATAMELDPGTYFIEIFNNTDGDSDTFIWETGLTGEIPGLAFAFEAPGENWEYEPTLHLAIEITGGIIGADCNTNAKPDECDLADGGSVDSNGNEVPDECEGCDGDANGDGIVDPLDSGFVLARLGCAVGTGNAECNLADQNSDEIVDPLDVGYVLSRFGPCE